jgi:hypothetical protein
MTRSIPWPRILAEGVAIVVSILLAFGIQAWWEERQALSLEADLLAALAEELEANQEALGADRERNAEALTMTDRFLRSAPESLAGLPPDSVFPLLDAFVRPVTFDAFTGTATLLSQTAILSSEGIAIRAMVTEWLARIADVDEEKVAFSDRTRAVQDLLAPYAARVADAGAARSCALIASQGPGILAELRRDSRFIEALVTRAGIQDVYMANLDNLRADLDSLSSTLARALGEAR